MLTGLANLGLLHLFTMIQVALDCVAIERDAMDLIVLVFSVAKICVDGTRPLIIILFRDL